MTNTSLWKITERCETLRTRTMRGITACLLLFFASLASASEHAPPNYEETLYAHCDIVPGSMPNIGGTVDFRVLAGYAIMDIKLNITGFDPNDGNVKHAVHVHEFGDLAGGNCMGMGGHWNPDGNPHGDRNFIGYMRHAGDYGNHLEDGRGWVLEMFTDFVTSLSGDYNVIGRGIVIHDHEDDLIDDESSGSRLGCCVIATSDDRYWPGPPSYSRPFGYQGASKNFWGK